MGCGNSKVKIPLSKRKFARTQTLQYFPSKPSKNYQPPSHSPKIKKSEKNQLSKPKKKQVTPSQKNIQRVKMPISSQKKTPKLDLTIPIPEIFNSEIEENISSCASPLSSKAPKNWNTDEEYRKSGETSSLGSEIESEEINKEFIKNILVGEENLTKNNRNSKSKGVTLKSPQKRGSVNLAYRGNNHKKLQSLREEAMKRQVFRNRKGLSVILTNTTDTRNDIKVRRAVFGESIIVKRGQKKNYKKLPSLPSLTLAPQNSKTVQLEASVFRKKGPAMLKKHSDIIPLPSKSDLRSKFSENLKGRGGKRSDEQKISINQAISSNFNSVGTYNYFRNMRRSLSSFVNEKSQR